MRGTRQHGFTLVELMIALAIGSLLLAGMTRLLMTHRATAELQQAQSHLQENARLAEFLISHLIAHAGYRNPVEAVDFPAVDIASSASRANSDSIRLSLQARRDVTGCLGEQVRGRSAFEFFVNQRGALSCRRFTGSEKTTQPLVEEVDRFKVLYGLDTNRDGATNHLTTTVTARNRHQVRSIRFQLLLRSPNNARQHAETRNYTFVDGETFSPRDRKARLLIDRTVAIRHYQP